MAVVVGLPHRYGTDSVPNPVREERIQAVIRAIGNLSEHCEQVIPPLRSPHTQNGDIANLYGH